VVCHQIGYPAVRGAFRLITMVSPRFSIWRPRGQELETRRTKAVSSWGLDISPGLVAIACFVGVLEPEVKGCDEVHAGIDAGVTLSGRAVDGI
jgi:hypothetical protein